MVGAVLVVLAMVVVLPVAIFLTGALWSALIGQVSTIDAEDRNR